MRVLTQYLGFVEYLKSYPIHQKIGYSEYPDISPEYLKSHSLPDPPLNSVLPRPEEFRVNFLPGRDTVPACRFYPHAVLDYGFQNNFPAEAVVIFVVS